MEKEIFVKYSDNLFDQKRPLVKLVYTEEEQEWNKDMETKVKEWIIKAKSMMREEGGRFYRGLGLLMCLERLLRELNTKLYFSTNEEINEEK